MDSVVRAADGTATLRGWAVDTAHPALSTHVDVYVGAAGTRTTADQPRPDVQRALHLPTAAHGFSVTVKASLTSTICAYALDATGARHISLGCARASNAPPRAHWDYLLYTPGGITLYGWAFDPAYPSFSTRVDAYVGSRGFSAVANLARPDVQRAYGLPSAAHGFQLTVTLPPGGADTCLYAINAAGLAHVAVPLGALPPPSPLAPSPCAFTTPG